MIDFSKYIIIVFWNLVKKIQLLVKNNDLKFSDHSNQIISKNDFYQTKITKIMTFNFAILCKSLDSSQLSLHFSMLNKLLHFRVAVCTDSSAAAAASWSSTVVAVVRGRILTKSTTLQNLPFMEGKLPDKSDFSRFIVK